MTEVTSEGYTPLKIGKYTYAMKDRRLYRLGKDGLVLRCERESCRNPLPKGRTKYCGYICRGNMADIQVASKRPRVKRIIEELAEQGFVLKETPNGPRYEKEGILYRTSREMNLITCARGGCENPVPEPRSRYCSPACGKKVQNRRQNIKNKRETEESKESVKSKKEALRNCVTSSVP